MTSISDWPSLVDLGSQMCALVLGLVAGHVATLRR
jgi:hypothetical protein